MPRAEGVLFCGGGTGGHVLPGIAVAARLRARGERSLRWIGDPERLEARLVPSVGIPLLPFGLSRPRPRDPRWLARALGIAWRCWRELLARPPRVVVALGGYASLVPGLLAPLTGRPLVVMEQNARPGRTNRLLARFARVVVTQFEEASDALPPGRSVLLGNPVREIEPLPRGSAPALRVLVAGGSLAARSLNQVLRSAAPMLAEIPHLEIVHISGEEERRSMAECYLRAGVHAEVHAFVDDMPSLYRRIDLAVSRAGATTVAELCAAGIGALYVPLPWAAEDHQTANAEAVARLGGALVMSQDQLDGERLAHILADFQSDRARVAAIGARARAMARPDAAERVAALLGRLGARGGRPCRARARASWRVRLQSTTHAAMGGRGER